MSPEAAKPFPHLFSPLPLGRRQARNRVFRAATATNLAEKFDVSDRLLAHYATLARGGAGVIVTESMRIHPSAVVRGSNHPGLRSQDHSRTDALGRRGTRGRRASDRAGQSQRAGAQQHHGPSSPDRAVRDRMPAIGRRAARDERRRYRGFYQAHRRRRHGTCRRPVSTASRCIARKGICSSSSSPHSRIAGPTAGAVAGRTAPVFCARF